VNVSVLLEQGKEAREAGRKGGMAASHRKAQHELGMAAPASPESDSGVDSATDHRDWLDMGSE
jgi:hypothetical protein